MTIALSQFHDDLLKAGPLGGMQGAQRLRTEVMKYILAHESTIPPHSKVVARVFYNGRAMLGERVQNGKRQYTQLEAFMVKFAETQPLFDFLDCGGGKERADDKIRGWLHSKNTIPRLKLIS